MARRRRCRHRQKATLPLVIYSEAGGTCPTSPPATWATPARSRWTRSGATNPHSGKTCLKVDYTASDNWGGVVWQNPANNWGDKAGGWNLTGAKKLTFWARGDKGGEVVTFLFGLIGKDKTYHDTGNGKLDNVDADQRVEAVHRST